MKTEGCCELRQRIHAGQGFRAVNAKYARSGPFDLAHTADHPSRFNPGQHGRGRRFEALYLAENPITALQEVEALFGSKGFFPNPVESWCYYVYTYVLGHVVDLTDAASQSVIESTVQEITGHWETAYYPRGDAPTQRLGEALFNLDLVEAIISPSAKGAGKNLLIFPQKLADISEVKHKDPDGKEHKIPAGDRIVLVIP